MPTGIWAMPKDRKKQDDSRPNPAGDSCRSLCTSGAMTARQLRKNWLSVSAKVMAARPRTEERVSILGFF
ncbi:hypothetical protein D3C86_1933720 [compost metagenome]